ncbi:hypothetical protein FACS1894189_4670 [Planctomycetales bacterium]|nr:hypothetical protein FACS1894189_4670 [Planctomycetales bacterium]
MNTWNKVFLGFIFVLAIAVAVLASVDWKIRSTGQQSVNSLENKIEKANQEIARIQDGSAPKKQVDEKTVNELGFEELRGKVIRQLYERGRAWFGCVTVKDEAVKVQTLPPNPLPNAPATPKERLIPIKRVEVQLVVTGPVENRNGTETVLIPESLKGVVYAFREGADHIPDSFLGRFSVESPQPTKTKYLDAAGAEKDGYQITLATVDAVNEAEIQHIQESVSASWTVYLSLPPGTSEAVATQILSDEEKEKILTELQQGQNAEVQKLWEKIRQAVDNPGKNSDFSELLNWLYQWRSVLNRKMELTQSNIDTYKAAFQREETENKKLEEDVALEEKRVTAMTMNRDKVESVLDAYLAEIEQTNLMIEKLQEYNKFYVAKIAEYQLKVKNEIERKANPQAEEPVEDVAPSQP